MAIANRDTENRDAADPDALIRFLRDLAVAMVRSGEPTSQVSGDMNTLARRYGARSMLFYVLPTGVFVRTGEQPDVAVDFSLTEGADLRLDQVGRVNELARDAEAGRLAPAAGSGKLAEILASRSRFGAWLIIPAQILQTLGLGLIKNPAPDALIGLAIIAVAVGMLRQLGGRFTILKVAMPVLAAIVVTVLALRLPAAVAGHDPSVLLIPPLITFLPGAALTVGTIELASDAIMAGSARIIYAFNVLFMLAFGILAGAQLAGGSTAGNAGMSLGLWAPLAGVILLGTGMYLSYCGPARSLPWLLAALFAVWLIQFTGTQSGSALLGAFLGGCALAPVTHLVERRPWAPPSQVIYLPAFWLLVPGSSSLAGLSELVSGSTSGAASPGTGLLNLVTALVTVFAIAIGTLVGSSMLRSAIRAAQTASGVSSRLRAWP